MVIKCIWEGEQVECLGILYNRSLVIGTVHDITLCMLEQQTENLESIQEGEKLGNEKSQLQCFSFYV